MVHVADPKQPISTSGQMGRQGKNEISGPSQGNDVGMSKKKYHAKQRYKRRRLLKRRQIAEQRRAAEKQLAAQGGGEGEGSGDAVAIQDSKLVVGEDTLPVARD